LISLRPTEKFADLNQYSDEGDDDGVADSTLFFDDVTMFFDDMTTS
jgi:hypothetical protein